MVEPIVEKRKCLGCEMVFAGGNGTCPNCYSHRVISTPIYDEIQSILSKHHRDTQRQNEILFSLLDWWPLERIHPETKMICVVCLKDGEAKIFQDSYAEGIDDHEHRRPCKIYCIPLNLWRHLRALNVTTPELCAFFVRRFKDVEWLDIPTKMPNDDDSPNTPLITPISSHLQTISLPLNW